MNMKRSSWWQLGLVACAAMLASCGGAEVAEEAAAPEPSVSLLEEAIEQRGEPCTCVSENLEAMSGLLESLNSTERITAQELNIQIAQMMLPCMKPTGNVDSDREYSLVMGKCPEFMELTEVMTNVKKEVQARVQEEAANSPSSGPGGAQGASAILDKLKEN